MSSYKEIINNLPAYSDSSITRGARRQADRYEQSYLDKINRGYRSEYKNTLSSLADKYTDNKFEWDTDSSAEYQHYSDKYRRDAAKALENTQGAYAANTGGYTNSYAQAAGQRVYGQYMDELAQKIPELRNSAYDTWQKQQEDTLGKISFLQGLDGAQYQRYRDSVSSDYDFMTYYENKYANSKGLDMSQFQNELSKWQSKLNAAVTRETTDLEYDY